MVYIFLIILYATIPYSLLDSSSSKCILTSYIMDNRIVMSSANFHTMDHTEEIMLSYHLDTY